MRIYHIILLAVFTFLALRGNAQFQNDVFENSFKHLNTLNGLSNDFVNQVVKDQNGFLWIATQNGLNRYDGVHIKTYYHNASDTNSICNNYVSALLADSKGRIWIGAADAGISVYNCQTQKIHSYFPSDTAANRIKTSEFVTSFFEDTQHRIWITTWGSGLYLFNEKINGFEQYAKQANVPNTLFCNKVKSIAEDKSGRLWVGLWAEGPSDTAGIQIFDPSRGSFNNYYSYLKNNFGGEVPKELRSVLKFVHSLTIDSQNKLWVAGLLGMAYIDLNDFSYKVFIQQSNAGSSTINCKTIRSITVGPDDHILAGSLDNGINILNTQTNTFRYITYDSESEKSLSNNTIKHILVDENGILFVATSGGGLNISLPKHQEYKFISGKQININGQTIGNGITAIGKSADNLIFSSNLGFLQWNTKTGETTRYTVPDIQKNNYTSHFIFNGFDPAITYLSTNYNFYQLNTETKKVNTLLPLDKSATLKFENINSIINWNKDTLIALSEYRGIEILDLKSKAITSLNLNHLNLSFWYSIARLDNEHILAGYRNGIAKINLFTKAATHLLTDSIPQKPVDAWVTNSIFCDHAKRWWFACDSSLGLLHLPNKGYTLFPVKQNELLVPFLGIQEDERGNLWLHSTYDIYHFDTQTKVYTRLHSNLVITNHATNSQSYLDPETGIFYVTSNEGVWMVDTRLFYNDQKLKKITISDFFINNESLEPPPIINLDKDLFLSYNQNSFSIHFSNFDYEQNKNYALEYKLVGASLNWAPAPKSQVLDFNNLEPGNYTLIIKYKNFPETHNTSLTLKIHISKPWWQTWWFLLCSFLLIAGSIQFYFQQQTKRLKERNIALELKVNERTQEFQIQKKQADDLLLNILPADIVTELKTKGSTEARLHENISVLFTDFVNFTGISAKLSPADLVREIDRSFKAFDQIMDKHGLEKIKTIGDSYMAVGGLNKSPLEGALATVHAALDIIDFVQNSDCLFEIRIGINTGPVIAGVVGHKKFAYDIWGSTVNIASRMESNGIPMRINISHSTYLQIKDYIHCAYRGQVDVKNMGAMEMYLVD